MQSMRSNDSPKTDLGAHGPSAEDTTTVALRTLGKTLQSEPQIYLHACAGIPKSTINHLLLTLSLLGNADYPLVNIALENSAQAG